MQRGQALLIVLLSMAVILTVVLSVLSRSVTDIAVTSRGEEAIRAFSAAEAGVEQALIGAGTGGSFEGSNFKASVKDVGKGLREFVYPQELTAGDMATVWFVSHLDNGKTGCDSTNFPCFTGSQLTLCWGETGLTYPDPDKRPAVEVSVMYFTTAGDPETAKIARAAFDSHSGRAQTNGFSGAFTSGCDIEGKHFPFSSNIIMGTGGLNIPSTVYLVPNKLQLATIRFLYNDRAQPFGFNTTSAGAVFPSQGTKITSTGTSGESTRKVEVLRLFADLPPIFQSVVFSPAGITK